MSTRTNMAPVSADHFWALLIGIDFYIHGNSRQNDSGRVIHYPPLGGCVNDVLLVRQFLLGRGALKSHITTLTATKPSGEPYPLYQATEIDPKHQTTPSGSDQGRGITRGTIIHEFERLTQSAKPGDSVYIHYSGHGGRAKSVYEAIKGPNALDESLVPSDIEIPGGQYLRDVELAFLLDQMVKRGLKVTLAIDSCHSGGATRAEVDVPPMVRGIGEVDATVLESDRAGIFDQNILFQQRNILGGESRKAEGQQGWLLDPQGYTLLAACLSCEFAREFRAPVGSGRLHGVFTFSLISSLRMVSEVAGVATNELIHGRVRAMVQGRYTNQTPVIQGDGGTAIFGEWKAEEDSAVGEAPIRVSGYGWGDDAYILDAGQLHGVNEGDEYVIFAAEGSTGGSELARVEVEDVQDITCTVRVLRYQKPNSKETIVPGCQAIFISPGERGQQRVARLVVDPGVSETDSQQVQRLIRGLENPPSGHSLRPRWRVIYNRQNVENPISPSDTKTQVSLLVHIRPFHDLDGAYIEIQDLGGNPLPRILPIPLAEPDAASTLSDYMDHILKYRRVQELTEYPGPDSHGHRTSFRVVLVSKEKILDDTPIPDIGRSSTASSIVDGLCRVSEGSYVCILFRNPTDKTVYLTVLDLQPDWGIAKAYPSHETDYEEVPAGQERCLQFRMTLPKPTTTTESRRGEADDLVDVGTATREAGRYIDTLKAVVMLHPSSLKQLLQSPIVPPEVTPGRGGRSEEESTEPFSGVEDDDQSRNDGHYDDRDPIPDLDGKMDDTLNSQGRLAELSDMDGKGVGSRRSQPRSWHTHEVKIETLPGK